MTEISKKIKPGDVVSDIVYLTFVPGSSLKFFKSPFTEREYIIEDVRDMTATAFVLGIELYKLTTYYELGKKVIGILF